MLKSIFYTKGLVAGATSYSYLNMHLVFNVGNSEIKMGLAQGDDWKHLWRFPTHPKEEEHFYELIPKELKQAGIDKKNIQEVIVSSVVPSITQRLVNDLDSLFNKKPHLVGPDLYKKLPIPILKPEEIGADLVANALAAHLLYKKNCIVVDFGTALTFTTVKADGTILGVAIAPGIKTAINALAGKAAQLPDVPIEVPNSALGTNTIHAIQAGTLIGYTGLVKEVIEKIRAEVEGHYIAVATGGLSFALPELEYFFEDRDRQLTLRGIRLMLEYV